MVYKIVSPGVWRLAQSSTAVPPMPVDQADGFIHLSTARQLNETLALHFAGRSEVVLLAVITSQIAGDLKWETSRGGDLFPHLYGVLPSQAIAWHQQIAVAVDGTCALPERVR
ncbi:MAG TPA: DUF952 domain-containing protein [Devosia sp.]|nr:DUF952 domain-containing protein [Devosia sp.]